LCDGDVLARFTVKAAEIMDSLDLINRVIEEEECRFQEGSLSMDEYLGEFCDGLVRFRNAHPDLNQNTQSA
ncbi:MAG: hypothetical protein ABSE74_00160, partial [Methanoregula sp.]